MGRYRSSQRIWRRAKLVTGGGMGAIAGWFWWRPSRILGLVGLALGLLQMFLGGLPLDLKVYLLGGATVVSDPSALYGSSIDRLPFTYPPIAGLFFAPFSLLPAWLAVILLTGGSLLCLLRTLQLVLRQLDGLVCLSSDRSLVLLTLGSLLLEPIWRTWSYGQVNLVLMWLVVEAVLGPKSDRGGWIVGVAAGFKLTPAVFGLYYLGSGNWRSLLRVMFAFAGTVVVGLLLLPSATRQFWTETVRDAERVGGIAYTTNQSVNGALWRLFGQGGWPLLWSALVIGFLALSWVTVRGFADAGEPLPALLTCAVLGLLISPISWSHHWVWAIPLLLFLANRVIGRPRDKGAVALAVAWLVATGSSIISILPAGEGVEYTLSPELKAISDTYPLLGMASLFWLWRASQNSSFHRCRPPTE